MPQYEYTQLQVHYSAYDGITDLLNEHGADGWEVVLETATQDYTCYLLKREKNNLLVNSTLREDRVKYPAFRENAMVGNRWSESLDKSNPEWQLTDKERTELSKPAERFAAGQRVYSLTSVETILRRRYEQAVERGRDALREQVARVEALADEINPWKRPAMSQVEIYRALDAALHPTDGAACQGCACEAEHDGDYGSSGHAGPCPRHTCDPTDGAT